MQKITRLLLSTFILFALIFSAVPAPAQAKVANQVTEQAVNDVPILQFTAGNSVVGFSPQKVFMASLQQALTVEFVNANAVTPTSATPVNEASGAPAALSRVTYPNLWDGVDVLYENDPSGVMKSTYLLAAGADVSNIVLRYNAPLQIEADGGLSIQLEGGAAKESAPIAWQTIDRTHSAVDVSFVQISEKEAGFSLGVYDPNYPVVIDPSYQWHAFYGGTSTDLAFAVSVDSNDNIIVVGASSATFTVGGTGPLNAHAGVQDVVVVKMNSAGGYLWHTFYGGSSSDIGMGVSVDSNDNIIVSGHTWQTFKVSGTDSINPHAETGESPDDILVIKMDKDGAYQWHTFYGGTGNNDQNSGIKVDSGDNIIVTGYSAGTFTVGSTAPINAHSGSNDVTIIKTDKDGAYQWHTFYGSSSGDIGNGVSVDSGNNIIVAGYSQATFNVGATDPLNAHSGTYADVVVVKTDSAGVYQWHTFYGGAAGFDSARGVSVDSVDNIIVAGYSTATFDVGATGPLNAYSGAENSSNILIVKMNSSGVYQWHTFYGGAEYDQAAGVSVDSGDNIIVIGESSTTFNIGGTAPLNAFASGTRDIVAVMTNSAGAYQWHTFYGGTGTDKGTDVSVDSSDNIVLAGNSAATFDVGATAPLNAYESSYDIMVVKMKGANTVTYDLGGGTGALPTQADVVIGGTFTVASGGGFSRTGYDFTGWDNGTSIYTGGSTYTMGANNITLTAQWRLSPDTLGDDVYGQPDFVSNSANNGNVSPSATSLRSPNSVAVDSGGNVYVSDWNNHRVLYYPAGSTTATRVYGQPDFLSFAPNNGGVSATSLNGPMGVALDSGGNLYVADSGNHRVLYYPAGSTTATFVYGQPGFTSNTQNNGGVSATSLNAPRSVALDSGDNLYVTDGFNHRILYYPSGSATATRVYGQPNFTSNTFNKNGLSATSLFAPTGVALDSGDNLYAADSANQRVLYYPSGETTATRVYGQPDFVSNTGNNGGVSATSLKDPARVALDDSDNLYVVDTSNHRVLYYPSGDTTAVRVYGQPDFASGTVNNGGLSATSLFYPNGVALDSGGNLYVAESGNNRALRYLPVATVTFDANGGSGTMSAQNASSATALTSNAFTRIGYTFTGWNTAANGSGTPYTDGATYDFTANLTLYAQWHTNASQQGPDFVVNTAADTDDGFCDLSGQGLYNQDCTLREAIHAANTDADASIITFAANYTITLGSALPDITTEITIDGSGHTIIIDGADTYRILSVDGSGDLTINQSTLQNGRASAPGGGGVYNNGGMLTVTHCIFSGNSGSSWSGGGINNSGTATVTNSTFSGNSAAGGSGISNSGTLTVTNSTFHNNSTSGSGGGILNNPGGMLTVTNSTFSGNSASHGGGVYNQNTLTVTNSTFSGNSASQGGGIYNEFYNLDATVHLAGNIFAIGTSGANCVENLGTINDNGYNLSDDASCGFSGTSADSADPMLGPLQDNGGPTQTHALLSGSDAINAIPYDTTVNNNGITWTCNDADSFTDQRGITRSQGVGCDAGAYEVSPENDYFVLAYDIALPTYTSSINTTTATASLHDPDLTACDITGSGLATVWYTYTPTANTAISIDTFGSDYDTFIAVWTGPDMDNLTLVACNNKSGTQEQLAIQVTQDTTYYIEVGQP